MLVIPCLNLFSSCRGKSARIVGRMSGVFQSCLSWQRELNRKQNYANYQSILSLRWDW